MRDRLVATRLTRSYDSQRFSDMKQMGRFLLRRRGVTVAAGLVTRILKRKGGDSDETEEERAERKKAKAFIASRGK